MGCGVSKEIVTQTSLPAKDHYQREELIGVGNHGRVYRSLHLPTGQYYALKAIDSLPQHQKLLNSQEAMEMAGKLKQLKCQQITQYYEWQMREKEVVIVMPLAKDGTLKKMIQKDGKIDEEIIAKITFQILQGLSYLHSKAVFHLDLKPSNVLMTDNHKAILSDYALAQLYDERLIKSKQKQKEDFSRGSSLPYMAPELIRHEGISQKADVWGLGCTIIQMITGKQPWSNINPKYEKAFKEITAHAIPPLPKDMSLHCKAFLERCLTINVAKRATVSELLKHPFITGKSERKEKVDNVKISMQKSDTANRISSRNSNKKDNEQPHKTPPSIEKTFKDENSARYNNRFQSTPKQTSENRFQSAPQMRQSGESSHQLKRLKAAVNNFGKVKKSRDAKAIHNDDILPQIVEDEEDAVMLNNRKVKMKPQIKIRTQQVDSLGHPEPRPSIQLQDDNSSYFSLASNPDRYRIKSKPSTSTLNHSHADSSAKVETQPVLMSGEESRDPEYFKRPLKLLKKKLKERQNKSRLAYVDHSDHFPTEPAHQDQDQQEEKTRTLTEQREEAAINTQLARAERDRYINEQLIMRRQKEAQKAKWQQELKQQSELIKKEFSHRYAYQRYHPVLNLI